MNQRPFIRLGEIDLRVDTIKCITYKNIEPCDEGMNPVPHAAGIAFVGGDMFSVKGFDAYTLYYYFSRHDTRGVFEKSSPNGDVIWQHMASSAWMIRYNFKPQTPQGEIVWPDGESLHVSGTDVQTIYEMMHAKVCFEPDPSERQAWEKDHPNPANNPEPHTVRPIRLTPPRQEPPPD